ncbi:egl nine homolog 1 [Nilaparvata lugens]|uniref:egl nine homolog 1 n=1 Tax=Nilaparvata lugens TaxID=108931 RepID=UPI00193D9593|nr:egl nine homolog 1 [Nilaparvata lugens]
MDNSAVCEWCRKRENLLRCSRCRSVHYCSKDHQCQDWENHKRLCRKLSKNKPNENSKGGSIDIANQKSSLKTDNQNVSKGTGSKRSNKKSQPDRTTSPITFEGSSENDIKNACVETLNPSLDFGEMPSSSKTTDSDTLLKSEWKDFSEIRLDNGVPFQHSYDSVQQNTIDKVYKHVVKDMDTYGVCVVDGFLGAERGSAVLDEVLDMYRKGLFRDGQLVSNRVNADLKTIRGDQIMWVDGKEAACKNIGILIGILDAIVMKANRLADNGKMGEFNINGRTKAMVACYPGDGSHYVKHVDNPNKDGRCITAIYYLNRDWDVEEDGGLLRIFPDGWKDQVADIQPLFDRILFFWSDRRNPHEVQAAFRTR